MTDSVGYIIVGSGPAGSVLAKRLSEDPAATICVLEAGPEDSNLFIRVPVGFVKTLYNGKFTWNFQSQPVPGSKGRKLFLPQGRVVGGSSSINGLVYTRGQREDFDDWRALGNEGWGYEEILPFFMRSETRIGWGDDRFRGRTGPLPITNPDWHSVLCDAFISGVAELGIPHNPDYNGAEQIGAGYFQRYIKRGVRVSCADAFLRPALKSARVELKSHATVVSLILEGRRAVGVKYMQGGAMRTLMARREVILCAGTLNSPKILQLSGIGSAELLKTRGIEVVHHLPGVGENYRDHYTVRIAARAKSVRTMNELSKGWRLGCEIAKWAMGWPSVLALSPSLVHVFWKTRPELTRGDIQVLFTPASYKPGSTYVLDDQPGMSAGARQQRPESCGRVCIASSDPFVDPLLQPNYLDHETDQRTIVAALKIARRLLNTKAMAPYLVEETMPGTGVSSDDEWLDFARSRGGTGYHMVGTCKMGAAGDPMAVVDSALAVRGIANLRVVDASIMPQVPSANTLAATLMVAEKAADLIKASQPLTGSSRTIAA